MLANHTHNVSLWGVGVVSFLWTISSMMVFSILPAFLMHEFHTSYQEIGFIEGIANAAAFLAKFLSGIFTDYVGSRLGALSLGSSLTVVCKLLFAFATTTTAVAYARILDRLSKGIRAAPADAILADLAPEEQRGLAYGFRQSFMTGGAVVGVLLATFILHATHGNYRAVMYISSIPALLALIVQLIFIKQPRFVKQTTTKPNKSLISLSKIQSLPALFWTFLIMFNVLMFARFSENFVVLRAMELHWPATFLPFVMGIMNLVHAFLAYPIGQFSDKYGHARIVFVGLLCLSAANIILFFASHYLWLVPALILIGIELSMTQGIMKAIFSRIVPLELRGTGFSLLAITTSLSLLYSNNLAGYFAQQFQSPRACFAMGLLSSLFTTVFLTRLSRQLKNK